MSTAPRAPFAFAFPPPSQRRLNLRYKDGPKAGEESKVHLIMGPPLLADGKLAELIDEGHYLLGICAFENWPARLLNPQHAPRLRAYDLFSKDYYRRFVGFLHNFREPRDVFPDDLPLLAMDYSDYVQVRKKGREKVYDLVYYAGHKIDGQPATVAWSRVVKQHDLARDLIASLLATDEDVRICLVNDSFGFDDPRVTRFDFLGYREFLDKLEESRVLLMSSVLDASPRVITEALCLDTYVMVNRRISGGWKYVNEATGAFFDETDALDVYRGLRARGPAATRAWFLRNYPNHVLEDRFNAWLNACIQGYCAFNRFGRVFHVSAAADGAPREAIRQELFRHMGIYGDCVEEAPKASAPNPHKARALGHLAALLRARELGLPDVVIFDDDFQFIAPRPAANRKIGALLEAFPAWDVLLFGNLQVTAHEATHDAAFLRVLGASAPHGYAVRAVQYDALIDALRAACAALPDAADGGSFALDEAWTRVVAKGRAHAFRDPLGEGCARLDGPPPVMGRMGVSCGE